MVCFLPRFFVVTHPGSRRRRAVYLTAGVILVAGSLLDLLLGAVFFVFPGTYLGSLHGVPYEEFLFYGLGGLAIVLVYFWADEFWLAAYNVRQRRPLIPEPGYIVAFSLPAIGLTCALLVIGYVLKRFVFHAQELPLYYSFLVIVGLTPSIVVYRGIKGVVNWRALSFTAVYILLTSCIWEVTLA